MKVLFLSLLGLSYIYDCQAQDDESTEPRLLSNQNTAAVTGAALGLGIGIAGSILVGKLIEDATQCKPQSVHPPAFGRFLPDLLHLKPTNCNPQHAQANNYRQPQSYPTPGYVIPSASTQYHQHQSVSSGYNVPNLQKPTVSSGYNVPNLPKPTISSGYNVPNLHQGSVSSGYAVPNLHKPTVSNGYSDPHQGYESYNHITSYAPTASNPNVYSQTSPHKASVDPPKETIELVNTDYTAYNEYSYSPNSAIQPRQLAEDDLFKPVQTQKQRHPKSFSPSQKNTFTETQSFKAIPNPSESKAQRQPKAFTPITQISQKTRKVESTFTQTASHKAKPNAPNQQKAETREAKKLNQQSPFTQTEAHKPEPNETKTSTRQAKSISSLAKLSASSKSQQKFQPLSLADTTETPFLDAFSPVSDSGFAPLPVTSAKIIARAGEPKLFGQGIVRFENKI